MANALYQMGIDRIKAADETLAQQIAKGHKMVGKNLIENLADCSEERFQNDLVVIRWISLVNQKKTTFPRKYIGVKGKRKNAQSWAVRGLKTAK